MDQFSYLGSNLTSASTCKKNVENRIRAAHCAFGQLTWQVFNSLALTMATKIMVFIAIVLSIHLCACKTWTLYRGDIKDLECFQQHKLTQTLRIPWERNTTNMVVLSRASMTSIEGTIIHHCIHWAGYIHTIDPSRLQKKLFYGKLTNGTKSWETP